MKTKMKIAQNLPDNNTMAAPDASMTITPEQFSASAATRMRASGGPIPGLEKGDDTRLPPEKITNDVAILNSALLLEYLEAEFYARVVAADAARAYLPEPVRQAARILARDEATHVEAVTEMIRSLGGAPLEKPPFQFPARVFISSLAFLQLSVELEENGVGAYLGAAPLLQNKNVLNFAASIYGNETRHTAWMRFLNGEILAPRDLERPRTIEEAVAHAAPYFVKDRVTPEGVA